MWELPELQKKHFSLKEMMKFSSIEKYRPAILAAYHQIPGTEIWSNDNLDITLNQIRYYFSNDMFEDQEEALILCQQLKQLMNHLYEMARTGKKFLMDHQQTNSEVDFQLYHNELSHSNNIIVVEHPDINAVYVTIDNLNYLQNNHPMFCEFMKQWIRKLKKNAQCISVESEGSRVKFFRKIEKRLLQFEKELSV